MFCVNFHSKLNEFRYDEKFCDVTIRVGEKTFMCHRVILAAASEYFDALFGSYFEGRNDQETVLHDIDVKTFTEVMEYVYTGIYKITVCSALDLLQAASFLRIDSMEKNCVDFIANNIPSFKDYIIDVFILVRALNITYLIHVFSQYILRNFKSFYNDEQFMAMSFDDLKFLVDKWELVHHSFFFKKEDLLLDLLIRWLDSAEEKRKHFEELIIKVDFERISSEYITFMLKYFENLVHVSDFKKTSAENIKFLMSMRKIKLNSNSLSGESYDIQDSKNRLLLKKTILKYFIVHKQCTDGSNEDMVPLLFWGPGIDKSELGLHMYVEHRRIHFESKSIGTTDEYLKDVEVYSINKYKPDWFLSCKSKAWYNCSQRCTVSQEPTKLMYCLESFNPYNFSDVFFKRTFCTYSSIDMSLASNILTPPPINSQTRHYNLLASQQCIFLHFFNREKQYWELYHYDCKTDTWFTICDQLGWPELKNCQLVVDDNLIYLFEGYYAMSLDYRTTNWTKLTNSHFNHNSSTRSCVLNGNIYLYDYTDNGYDVLETFDSKAGKWNILPSPKMPFNFFLPYENVLWGFNDPCEGNPNNPVQIKKYSPISNEWCVPESKLLLNEIIATADDNRWKTKYKVHYSKIKDIIVFKSY